MLKRITTVCFFCLYSIAGLCQGAPFRFRNLGVNDGLSQNSIWQLLRSKSGYMWIGTADGLNRYDGYNITTFKHSFNNRNSIAGNNITFLYEDRYGCLWVGTEAGVDVFNPVTEVFRHAFLFSQSSPANHFSYLMFDEPGGDYLYLSLDGKRTQRFDVKLQQPTAVNPIPLQFPLKPYGKFMKGYRYKNKSYLLFDNGYLEEVDLLNRSHRLLVKIPGGSYDFKVVNDNIYYVSDRVLITYSLLQRTITARIAVPQIKVCTSISSFGNKWIIASESGYAFADTAGTQVVFYESFDASKKQGYNRISSFLFDDQGMLWFGTDGRGLYYTSLYSNKFALYQGLNDDENMVKGICLMPGNRLVTAVYKKGLVVYQTTDHSYKNINGPAAFPGMQTDQFTAVCPAGRDEVWVSNTERSDCGIYLVNITTGKGINYSHLIRKFHPLTPRTSYFTYLCREDDKLYAVSYDIVVEIYKEKGAYTSRVVVNDSGLVFTCLYLSRNRKYFFTGHAAGVIVRKPGDPAFRLPLKQDAFELTKCVNEDLQGNYYVATTSGLYCYSSRFVLLKHYTTANGLADNFVYGILRDDAGNLWLSHNKGLSCFNVKQKTFKHYSVNDGLQSNEFNTGAFYRDGDGRLCFGGVNGVNVFYPEQVQSNPGKPVVYISNITVFDEPYKSDTAYWLKKEIVLPYNQNTLSFDFITTEMSDQQRNSYAYKMEGIDDTWINNGNKRSARYPNLAPGHYTFLVKAANPDGTWNDEPASLQLQITPPFWKTGWFYALSMALGSALLISIVFLVISRQQRKLKAELEVQQKLEDQRLRISRDLHDHVGAQLSYLITNIDWMREHPGNMSAEESDEHLSNLSDTGKQAILTLRQTIWALNSSELIVTEFADKFKQYAHKMMQFSAGTEITFHERFERNRVLNPSDALNLFRICQETLSNALRHAQARNIEVSFVADDKVMLGFTLNDDGHGFAWEELDTNGHYGLENMKARAAECGARLIIKSSKGAGTQVSLTLLKDYCI